MERPHWERRTADLLRRAIRSTRLLGCCTPVNFSEEVQRLEAAYRAGDDSDPRFRYRTPAMADLRPELSRAAHQLESWGPLAKLYSERAHELIHEADICWSANTAALREHAERRYRRRDAMREAADRLARSWLAEADLAPGDNDTRRSDDESDPLSLISRMRALLGELRLPFRVEISHHLAAIAATGPGVIYVAADRQLSHEAVERTVLHEVYGHAQPRQRAQRQPLALFDVGSAWGSDDQEGRALLLERRANLLGRERRLELARRHIAASAVRRGATFRTTVQQLRQEGTPLCPALRIAARCHRGGGLAREIVYLPAMLRVEATLEATPSLDAVLSQGKISVDAAAVLADLMTFEEQPPSILHER